MMGKNHSDEAKYKIRMAVINDLQKKGITGKLRNHNPDACKYLDKLSKERGWNLRHALNGGEVELYGYFVDGYDKEKSVIVEYDEPSHHKPDKKKKDIIRQNNLASYFRKNNVNINFWRYDELYDTLEKVI